LPQISAPSGIPRGVSFPIAKTRLARGAASGILPAVASAFGRSHRQPATPRETVRWHRPLQTRRAPQPGSKRESAKQRQGPLPVKSPLSGKREARKRLLAANFCGIERPTKHLTRQREQRGAARKNRSPVFAFLAGERALQSAAVLQTTWTLSVGRGVQSAHCVATPIRSVVLKTSVPHMNPLFRPWTFLVVFWFGCVAAGVSGADGC
jgi:hypothetical protein